LLLPILAGGFLFCALVAPRLLRPLNYLWHQLGLLLERLTAPLVAAVIYYVVLTPTAILLRLGGRESIDLRLDKSVASYWKPRMRDRSPRESLTRQF
jgi:hypothetical protein